MLIPSPLHSQAPVSGGLAAGRDGRNLSIDMIDWVHAGAAHGFDGQPLGAGLQARSRSAQLIVLN